ncbi:MAG: sulfite exporter TauE/SafE family protein [Betaproteobacteria bacterium]|jgi:hypothetical protein|nr:sulfite exporter TauE/SafE family protein [Betaproteobacteria bacterium]
MDWTMYWFMFPVAICVATLANLSGIGGPALFIPIFVIVFPLLGPEYPMTTAAAIGTALFTGVFGFSSGLLTYHRRRLIDFRSAVPFLGVAVPVTVVGALLLAALKEHELLLKGGYATLMLALCPVILRHAPPPHIDPLHPDNDPESARRPTRRLTDRQGNSYVYRKPKQGASGGLFTALGAFLTGLLGVGMGEVIMPQLVKRNHVPVAVAAATSVFTVILVFVSASFTQIAALVAAGGVAAIPWNLVCYTVPGVIIGGQIGPRLQGRFAQRTMERAIAVLFGFIGLAMGFIVLRGLGALG